MEFCIAKFADIPCVILRTDFRGGGDQGVAGGSSADPWNLMCSFWPRCERVIVDGMAGYKAGLARAQGELNVNAGVSGVENVVELDSVSAAPTRAGEMLLRSVAGQVVEAMGRVVKVPSVMPRELREGVWKWIGLMPGFKEGGGNVAVEEMLGVLRGKEKKGM